MAQDGLTMSQGGSKMVPKWPQDGWLYMHGYTCFAAYVSPRRRAISTCKSVILKLICRDEPKMRQTSPQRVHTRMQGSVKQAKPVVDIRMSTCMKLSLSSWRTHPTRGQRQGQSFECMHINQQATGILSQRQGQPLQLQGAAVRAKS